jgi:ABC-type dipeptide/oligopeptide/nickel transport system permease subunit
MSETEKKAAADSGSGGGRRRRLSIPGSSALRTLLGSPKARIGFAIVLVIVLVAAFAPLLAPGDPKKFVGVINQAPSAQHPRHQPSRQGYL